MGIFTAAVAVVGILNVFQSFGVAVFVIREPQNDPLMLSTALKLNAIMSILLSLAIAGLSTLGGAMLREPGVQHVMMLLAPVPLLSIPQFLPGNFRSIALVTLTRVFVTSSLTVALAFSGVGYLSLAWGTLAGTAASSAAFVIVGRRHLSSRLSGRVWRTIAKFSGQQFAIQGVNEIAGRLTDFAVIYRKKRDHDAGCLRPIDRSDGDLAMVAFRADRLCRLGGRRRLRELDHRATAHASPARQRNRAYRFENPCQNQGLDLGLVTLDIRLERRRRG